MGTIEPIIWLPVIVAQYAAKLGQAPHGLKGFEPSSFMRIIIGHHPGYIDIEHLVSFVAHLMIPDRQAKCGGRFESVRRYPDHQPISGLYPRDLFRKHSDLFGKPQARSSKLVYHRR
jgi:hypothetical protein